MATDCRQLNLAVQSAQPIPQLFVNCYDDAKNQIPATCVMLDRWVVQIPNGAVTPPGNGLNCEFLAPGYNTTTVRPVDGMPPDNTQMELGVIIEMEPSAANFPDRAVDRAELPPQEPDDENGKVYGVLPPEFLALPGADPIAANIDLHRADAFSYQTTWTAESVNPICTTAWLQSIGQNTNFGNTMWYTPLLPLYPMDVQLAFYADYSRFFTHIMLQGSLDPALVRASCLAAHASGLWAFVFDWNAQTFANLSDCIDGAIIGLEVDKIGAAAIAAGQLDATIAATCAACVPNGIRVWLHFTASGGPDHVQHWAFPVPPMSFTDWWAQNQRLGVTGFLHQAYENTGEEDSAGKMGAMMFYARQGLATASSANPSLKPLLVSACEILSVRPFYGLVDGPYAWRRATEMVCCPNNGTPFMPGVCGGWNGARRGMGPSSVGVL